MTKVIPTQADRLLPCPFCGVADAFSERSDFSSSYVVCNACSARGPTECQSDDGEDEPGRDAAILSWNRRTPDLAARFEIERLREALSKIANDPYKFGQHVQRMKKIAAEALS